MEKFIYCNNKAFTGMGLSSETREKLVKIAKALEKVTPRSERLEKKILEFLEK